MEKMLVITPSRCIGCRTCELACAFVHQVDGRPGTSCIRVFPSHPEPSHAQDQAHMPLTCLQCADAACQKVCPVQALGRNEVTGALEVDLNRCISCGACTLACPFGHIILDRPSGQAVKCDLCQGLPACASFCPTRTLVYVGI